MEEGMRICTAALCPQQLAKQEGAWGEDQAEPLKSLVKEQEHVPCPGEVPCSVARESHVFCGSFIVS